MTRSPDERLDLPARFPLLLMHAGCGLALWTGVNSQALAVCGSLYLIRFFGLTAGYHRYFAHRSYETSRAFQFLLALLCVSAAQRGPLWWVAQHRRHHRYADTPDDPHTPTKGWWWAYMGWLLCKKYVSVSEEEVPDLAKFPELRWLDRYHFVVPLALAVALWAVGGWMFVAWGFFVSTVLLYQVVFSFNILAHSRWIGSRRFETSDQSRNSFWVALYTLGDGWHNNHHALPSSARHGLVWWEIDLNYYLLSVLSWLGLVWNLQTSTHQSGPEAP